MNFCLPASSAVYVSLTDFKGMFWSSMQIKATRTTYTHGRWGPACVPCFEYRYPPLCYLPYRLCWLRMEYLSALNSFFAFSVKMYLGSTPAPFLTYRCNAKLCHWRALVRHCRRRGFLSFLMPVYSLHRLVVWLPSLVSSRPLQLLPAASGAHFCSA